MLKLSESWVDSPLALELVCVHTGYMWSKLVGAMVEKKSGLVVQYHPWLVTYDEWLALANRQQVMYEASESERWSRRCGQQMRLGGWRWLRCCSRACPQPLWTANRPNDTRCYIVGIDAVDRMRLIAKSRCTKTCARKHR